MELSSGPQHFADLHLEMQPGWVCVLKWAWASVGKARALLLALDNTPSFISLFFQEMALYLATLADCLTTGQCHLSFSQVALGDRLDKLPFPGPFLVFWLL